MVLGVGALAGLAAGVGAALFIAARPGPRGSKAAAIGVALLGLPLLGGMVAVSVADAPRRARNAEHQSNETLYKASAVRQTVCAHDADGLRREFAKRPDTAALARALGECTFWPDGDRARQQEAFSAGMRLLAAAPGSDRSAGGMHPTGYCDLLVALHGSQPRVELVRALKGLGLPLSCLNKRGEPVWWSGLERPEGDWQWLQSVRDGGVDVGARAERTGETALDRVVRCHAPRIVRLVLDAAPAIAPHEVSGPAGQRPPTAWWALRHFEPANTGCRVDPADAETAADVAAIDARMGDLTREMVNQAVPRDEERRQFRDGTLLWHVGPTPNAPLLAHLLNKGADIQARNSRGESFLHDVTEPTTEFLAVLARVPHEQIRRLAEPAPGANGGASEALVEHARKSKRAALVEFLCARGASGCGASKQ